MGAKADRKLLTVAGVLVLAGLVAVASQGASVWAPPRPGGASPADVLATIALVFVLGSFVAGALSFTLYRTILARRSDVPPLRTLLVRALPTTTAALVALSLLALTVVDLGSRAEAGSGPTTAAASSERRATPFSISNWFDSGIMAGEGDDSEDPPGAAPDPAQTPPLLQFAGAVATALAVAAAAWYAMRSRSPRKANSDRDTAHGAVLGTIDAMLADPDPRTAIIGAYARLLEELAAVGGPRRDYEGPVEHLRRVLTTLHVRPEPLRRLVELFELARFSDHRVTASHRDRALEALQEVAEDLARDGVAVGAPERIR